MFGRNSKVNLELNREVEKLIKTGGKEQLLPIVQVNRYCASRPQPTKAN